jgi:hypothetical protein
MDIIKKKMNVEDAAGWYLINSASRHWTETVTDEETGEEQEVERSEIICGKGSQINPIIASLLIENGVTTIEVSNVPLLGQQNKSMNLWETVVKQKYRSGEYKKTYYVTADCPTEAEKFISEYISVSIDCLFEVVKVNKVDYNKVIKIYDIERDEIKKIIRWYKCQIYSAIDDEDDDGTSRGAGNKNVLVQAVSFEQAIAALKTVMNRNEYDSLYNTFKLLQELCVVEVFIPDENVSYYSNEELS